MSLLPKSAMTPKSPRDRQKDRAKTYATEDLRYGHSQYNHLLLPLRFIENASLSYRSAIFSIGG